MSEESMVSYCVKETGQCEEDECFEGCEFWKPLSDLEMSTNVHSESTDVHKDDEESTNVHKTLEEYRQMAYYRGSLVADALRFERSAYLAIGQNLTIINKIKLWKYMGPHIERFEDFLKDNNLGVKIAYEYMRVWDVFKDYTHLTEGLPLWKLIGIAHLKRKTSIMLEDLVSQLSGLTYADFKDEIKSIKGGTSYLECDHEEQEVWAKCKKCGKFFKVDD